MISEQIHVNTFKNNTMSKEMTGPDHYWPYTKDWKERREVTIDIVQWYRPSSQELVVFAEPISHMWKFGTKVTVVVTRLLRTFLV